MHDMISQQMLILTFFFFFGFVFNLLLTCDIVGGLFFYVLTLYSYMLRAYAMEICQKKKQLVYQIYLRWIFQ